MNILGKKTASEKLISLAGESKSILSVFEDTSIKLDTVNASIMVEQEIIDSEILRLEVAKADSELIRVQNAKVSDKIKDFLNN